MREVVRCKTVADCLWVVLFFNNNNNNINLGGKGDNHLAIVSNLKIPIIAPL